MPVPTAPGVPKAIVAAKSVQYVNVPASLPAVTAATVKSTVPGVQTAAGSVIISVGCGSIVTATLVNTGHGPLVVYVTVYPPGVDALTSIRPVAGLMLSPAGKLENVPNGSPVIVGVGSEPFAQYEAAP